MTIFEFHHIHLVCSDLEKSIAFFTHMFDADLQGRVTFGESKGAILHMGGLQINLRVLATNEVAGEANDLGYHHLGFTCEDVDLAYREFLTKGARFRGNPINVNGFRVAFLQGPDRIVIELMSPL